MHILVVNDDGPPSQLSSPYVHSFIAELQSAGHAVSVVLPHTQRSWIGKAHLVGKTLTPTYFRPGELHTDDGTTHDQPREDGGEEWILVDGTPASCAQIGLYHYFQEKGPVDLVVSGPNYGRNSTALFALSSGTVGGAMEAAVCKKHAIALSYAFHDRNHDPVIIKGASKISVRVVEHLAANWTEGVDLYTVNVPLIEGVEDNKVLYTHMLQNYWESGSSFQEMEAGEAGPQSPVEREMEIREDGEGNGVKKAYGHKIFKWSPSFGDVYASVEKSEPGNDGLTVKEGNISVTPLRANFMHFDSLVGKQISLSAPPSDILSQLTLRSTPIYALVDYEDAYVQPKIIATLRKHYPSLNILTAPSALSSLPKNSKILHWRDYESLPFESALEDENTLLCSYIIRKALIRKHHLATTVRHHVAKNPTSILARAFPLTCELELDYAEYLDEALAEAYELRESLAENEHKSAEERKYWILKPGMSDRAQGIRVFGGLDELEEIFQGFEEDSDDENGDEGQDGIVTSNLRHFITQEYIHPPLLVDERKFHIRTYVLAVGGLRVYVYQPMLALFAASAYAPPWTSAGSSSKDLEGALTNTCLQTGEREGSVRLLSDLFAEGDGAKLPLQMLSRILADINEITKELFEAAARGQRVHFQTLPNAFEVFGCDFMVDAEGRTSLLEVNSYPDFRQTGQELERVVEGLLEEVVGVVGEGFLGESRREAKGGLRKVLDIKLGGW